MKWAKFSNKPTKKSFLAFNFIVDSETFDNPEYQYEKISCDQYLKKGRYEKARQTLDNKLVW